MSTPSEIKLSRYGGETDKSLRARATLRAYGRAEPEPEFDGEHGSQTFLAMRADRARPLATMNAATFKEAEEALRIAGDDEERAERILVFARRVHLSVETVVNFVASVR